MAYVEAGGPVLAGEQVAHVAVGVERLDEHAHERVRVPSLAELGRSAVEPELRRLGDHRRGAGEHCGVALVDLAQRVADLLLHRRRDGEHGHVEVPIGHERDALAPLQRVDDVLEVGPADLRRAPADELLVTRLGRPAGQRLAVVVDADQRLVVAVAHVHLRDDRDLAHPRPAGRGPHLLDRVEEREPDAARPQHLVERREHGVAHPRLHPPQDRARCSGTGDRIAPCSARPAAMFGAVRVAVHEGKGPVVDAAQEDRVAVRPLRSTSAPWPASHTPRSRWLIASKPRTSRPSTRMPVSAARRRPPCAARNCDVGVLGERLGRCSRTQVLNPPSRPV